MNAERPTPNSDSARPVATWFARSDNATTAKITDSAAAANAPAATPSHGDCVCAATMNDAIAPTSIIPSTPRFSTPDFSTTSSPSAANTSGVPAARLSNTSCVIVSIVRRRSSAFHRWRACAGHAEAPWRVSTSSRHRRLHDAYAVIDENVRGEQEEQERALEQSRHCGGEREVHLGGLAAEVQQRHQQAGQHDAGRVQASDERNDDRREAVP